MKILITGCTASQASARTVASPINFVNLMQRALLDAGVDVVVQPPSINRTIEELEQYDKVILGIAPPTSASAHYLYQAFSVGHKANKIGNLQLFVDAPEPHKIQASINSLVSGKSDLSKEFFAGRKNYSNFVKENNLRTEVNNFVMFLNKNVWPTTYFPAFPWSENPKSVPMAEESWSPLVLDSYILNGKYKTSKSSEAPYWVADSPNTPWVKSIQQTLHHEVVPIKQNKYETEESYSDRARFALGSLVATYRSNQSWWSPLLSQSLSVGTPVITDWRYTSHMGIEWSILGSSVEEMDENSRYELAVSQRNSYIKELPKTNKEAEKFLSRVSTQERVMVV